MGELSSLYGVLSPILYSFKAEAEVSTARSLIRGFFLKPERINELDALITQINEHPELAEEVEKTFCEIGKCISHLKKV